MVRSGPVRRGEAGWIDLPGGKNLLFLLVDAYRGDDDRIWLVDRAYQAPMFYARHWRVGPLGTKDHLAFLKRLSETPPGVSIDLVPDELPLLVTIKDVREPLLTVLDPRDLAAGLGKGIQFSKARLEITHDPLVWGLEGRLPWLGQHSPGAEPVAFERQPLVHDGGASAWGDGPPWIYDTILQAKEWR